MQLIISLLPWLLSCLLLFSPSLQAECYYDEISYGQGDGDICEGWCVANSCFKGYVTAKGAAFFPMSSKVRRIYGTALPAFSLEGNLKVWQGCGELFLWIDGGYVFGNGRSYGLGNNTTHVNLVPIGIGLKYLFGIFDCIDLYLAIGPCYSFLSCHDHSQDVHRKTAGNNVGGIVKTGIVYNATSRFFVEGFFNYCYQTFEFHGHASNPTVERCDVNFSSVQLGGGIGCRF